MIENLINDIQQAMLDVLDNEQLTQLRKVLDYTFRNVDVTEKVASDATADNETLLKSFLAAKRVEGCSEKSQFLEMLKGNSNNMCLSDISQSISKGITPKYVDQSNILVINQACVNWGSLDFSKVKYHNEDVTYTKGILHRDDILLTMTGRGTLGRCNIFNPQNQGKTYIADGHISIIRLDNEILLPELFTAYIALSDTQNEIYRNYVTGSTNQLDIVFSEIQQMPIPIPEMVRQKAYVDIVRQADKSKYYEIN